MNCLRKNKIAKLDLNSWLTRFSIAYSCFEYSIVILSCR
jgi:hypothetical protein